MVRNPNSKYLSKKTVRSLPRIPLQGFIDLTYRCNLDCRHCWIRLPANSPEKKDELSVNEVKEIVDESWKMGCRNWYISGGEPLLRADFPELFEYIISKSSLYSLNTNGTLITPEIARMMKRKGQKWIALYGATPEVYDHITRIPGSFEAAMRGFARLKEAGAGFVVQIIPLKDNYHQFQDMVRLAESLSPHWRIGISWLYLSASGDPIKNKEIRDQRLEPEILVELMGPNISSEDSVDGENETCSGHYFGKEKPFAACIDSKRDFHIDPYGRLGFCSFIKDPSFLYDIRRGSFQEGWNYFIPSLADEIRVQSKSMEYCATCEIKPECSQCAVYSYLENRDYGSRVDYLCRIEREIKRYRDKWKKSHRRYYQIAGLTIQVNADLPITESTFLPALKRFEVKGPGDDIVITHHFTLPDISSRDLGREMYRRPPWAIYRKGKSWIYLYIMSDHDNNSPFQIAVFNHDYSRAVVYTNGNRAYSRGNLNALTLLPTDQLLLASVLAHKQAFMLHSSGVLFEGNGLLFVGHSEAGKSTMVKILKGRSEILCDDRNIIRKWPEGYRIYGTWSHGEVPLVSPASAPLKAVFFLNKSQENKILPVSDKAEAIRNILGCLIKPLRTEEWWESMFGFVEQLVRNIPCYNLHFDKTGQIVDLLKECLLNDKRESTKSGSEAYGNSAGSDLK
jgi:radical SAM protein with 4Fe4S-binding SPASM domain